MVLSSGSIDKSQHRMQNLSPGISDMALQTQRIHGLDVNRFPPMGAWETCVPLTILA